MLCTAVAGRVFEVSGGRPVGVAAVSVPDAAFEPQLAAFAAFGITFLALNNSLVLFAISLSSRSPFEASFPQLVREARKLFCP